MPNTIASVTGIGLNIAVGTVFAGGNTDVRCYRKFIDYNVK
jgi:hypothetical protein